MQAEFFIEGLPIAKGRPRVTKRGYTYTPKRTKRYEDHVRDCYLLGVGEEPSEDGLLVYLCFTFPIPKSYPKKRVEAIRTKRELYTKKPDLDNLAKTVLDALNGVAYEDDSQVVGLHLRKEYSRKPGDVGVSVYIQSVF